jgi:exosortase A
MNLRDNKDTLIAAATGVAETSAAVASTPLRWAGALLLLATVWLVLWYSEIGSEIVAIWWRSETFTHGFLVAPISAWLVWRMRHRLAALAPRPAWPVLGLVALAGFAWMAGRLASVAGVTHFALVIMMQLAAWTILGTRIAKALSFPLAFLLFAVPFGEFLFPVLIDMTADFTVAALRLTGIPVYREGAQFVIPSGSWSVVEACSGLRYLIASMMIGTLYAYLNYSSLKKRLVFFGASIAVPLVANWLRAYMIVMLGHVSNNRIAVGVDHLIYGWIFFGVVMLIMFWIGARYQDDAAPAEAVTVPAASRERAAPVSHLIVAAAAVILAASVWKPVPELLVLAPGPAPVLTALPGADGWQPRAEPYRAWTPHYGGPDAVLQQTFQRDGAWAGLYIAYYTRQTQGRELIRTNNVLVSSEDPRWAVVASGSRPLALAGATVDVDTAELRGPDERLVAWRWYWVAGRYTASEYAAKLWLAYSRLLGRGDDSAVVVVFTPKGRSAAQAQRVLEALVSALGPAIDRDLARAAGR